MYLSFIFREVYRNIRQNGLAVAVAIVSNTALFLLFGVFMILYYNLDKAVLEIKGNVRVVGYLRPEMEPDILGLVGEISAFEEVNGVRHITKEAALADFLEKFGGSELIEGFEGNPLPSSLEIFIKRESQEPGDIDKLVKRLEGTNAFTELQYGKKWVEKLNMFLDYFYLSVVSTFSILCFAVLVLISNITKLTLLMRKDEIRIMKWIGATNSVIRIPFIFEGMLVGGMGGLLSLLVLKLLFDMAVGRLSTFMGVALGGFSPLFLPPAYLTGILAAGFLIGGLGTLPPLRNLLSDE